MIPILTNQFTMNFNHTANTTASKVLIDVRLTPPLLSPQEPTQMYSQQMTPAVFRHLSSFELEKLRGPNRSTTTTNQGSQIIEECLSLGYQISPFIVDPFGLLGPIAADLLLGPDTPASKFQLDPSHYSTPSTQQAIRALYHPNRFNDILRIADLKWKSNKSNNIWFTDSYKATLPSQWARQILSCGIAKALSSHVDNAFSVLRSHHHQSSHISPTQFSRYSSDSL